MRAERPGAMLGQRSADVRRRRAMERSGGVRDGDAVLLRRDLQRRAAELRWPGRQLWLFIERELLPEPDGDGWHLRTRQRPELPGDHQQLSIGQIRGDG